MSIINISHSHRWVRVEILTYLRDAEPLIEKLCPGIRRPVFLLSFWGRDQNIEVKHTGSRSGWAGSGWFTRRRSMSMGSGFGIELDVTTWLTLQRSPRSQCSEDTTRVWIEDVSRLEQLCFRLASSSDTLDQFRVLWIDKARAKYFLYLSVGVMQD